MIVFDKPHALIDVPLHYCPGCTHGIVHRLVAEVMDELGIEGKTIGIAPVGCSVMAYDYFNCDMIEAAHGRAPAVATGVKRADPSKIVFTYQGDGDLASIGMAETVHAAAHLGSVGGEPADLLVLDETLISDEFSGEKDALSAESGKEELFRTHDCFTSPLLLSLYTPSG